ncbi:RNA-dependent RNA polymerase [Piry virus]|uniref:RNA-directed RNA polymerase L n=3 Tax=Piry virus TaxID=11274 RepID=A0A1I9L1X2_PIRYV|nr:RNA-dependent RNA polymerase [Piry virus]AMR98951.1 RNA-dependent RNA polymerase [Piry virus]
MDSVDDFRDDFFLEENFFNGKLSKDKRIRGLNSVDYNLNSPLISDDVDNLLKRSRGGNVPRQWKKKNWDRPLMWMNRNHTIRFRTSDTLHKWFGGWLLHKDFDYTQGRQFLAQVDKESKETFEVVSSFLKGWVGKDVEFQEKTGHLFKEAAQYCQRFLDLHKLTLLMNASTAKEQESILNTLRVKNKLEEGVELSLKSLGKVVIVDQFIFFPQQLQIIDRNFMLMMKDVVIGRMQTILSMINRSDDKFPEKETEYLLQVYKVGDMILRSLGNDGYELIKTVEPMCNLRLSDLARTFRPKIPVFPRFRAHVQHTVEELSEQSPLIKDLFDLIDNTPSVDITLVIYGSFRHWGHPFIDYFKGLEKLHTQVTLKKEIDSEYAEALASDLARVVLTKEFNEKKKWAVDLNKVPKEHPFYSHIYDNTWPTAALIQDFGDNWHRLPLIQCFEIPDLIDPSVVYSDKSHSMNKKDVINHIQNKPDQIIPSKKVLETMINNEATNWLEFLEMVDKHGLEDDDLIIGLKGKERELKIAGRFFSLMSWKLREYFVITEYLIKTHFVPLFHGLTMADDMTAVIKKMLESSSGQGLSDYSAVCLANHIDYEKWNNHQRKESNGPVFRVMGQFLGYPNLILRTHEFFEKSLIYYNGRPDLMTVRNGQIENNSNQRVCWQGQAGGLEGLRQKGWSILNLLVIQREAKIRNTAVKVLAQGDNQVICTQYKTKQHRDEQELAGALEQMRINNNTIMEAIEAGTNKLGLLINQDETMQSADYLNYGKVPIFRGVIRGLETKRWSRVTCVTNDQLPTCANLMSSVSTNALTVAHFDTTPINAMVQYNYFGNFSRLLLEFHDPAIRTTLYSDSLKHLNFKSFAFKIGMLYLDPSIGGVCGMALSRFLIRSFPDPVTESLAFWKLIYHTTKNKELQRLSLKFGNPKIAVFRSSHIDKLLEDPTSLNIAMGMSPANLLKTEIKNNLLQRRSTIRNRIVRDAVFHVHKEDANIRAYLWSITPLFPRFLSEFKSGTFMGVADSIVSLFQNSRTIRNVFKDYMSYTIDDLIVKSEITSLEHLCSYESRPTPSKIWGCSATQADMLRRQSWTRKVLGTTIPHPLEMEGKGVIKTNLSKCCDNSAQDYISVHCPKGLVNILDSRGDLPAYLGSKTSESTSILQPWEKESKIPMVRRATRLRDAIHWFVEPDSNLAKSILLNIKSLTGEDWGNSIQGFKRTGSALHRFTTSRVSHGGFSAQSPAALTRMMATTDTMGNYATKNFDFMFQACLLYSQMSTSIMLENTQTSNTVHFHTRCLGCIREIEEPTLESPGLYKGQDVHQILTKWRNGQGSWGCEVNQLSPREGDWESLSPAEKSYHVGRTLGFLYGDLVGQSSHRAEDSSIFPVSIQSRVRGRGFLRGILDGLIRASACQVIHRRSIATLIKPANAIYGGLIFLIDKIGSSPSFINLCRDGPLRHELSSIPHKIPTSYPTSNIDMGLCIRNYLRYQCKSVELGKYKSDISDLWLFSDLMTVEFAGPFSLSTKILKCLYKPTLSKHDRTNIRKISSFSRVLRSQEAWEESYREYLTANLLVCREEVRHACKFGILKDLTEKEGPRWGREATGTLLSIDVFFRNKAVQKRLKVPMRVQNPTISGLRLGQLPTGAHYKLRTIVHQKKIGYQDAICGGDGSGGMTSMLLRWNKGSRCIFNSILEFDGSALKGTSPDPPSALETVQNGLKRCVNAKTCWENPSDLSDPNTWEYFLALKKEFTLNIDLIVLDMEVREPTISQKIEQCIRQYVSKLLSPKGTLIYKTYAKWIAELDINALTVIGPLFESVSINQTIFSSSQTSEVYMVCTKQKGFVDVGYVDWDDLQYHWDKLFCFKDVYQEYQRAKEVSYLDTLQGVPAAFLPDACVNLETLMQLSGIPTGISHQLGLEFKSGLCSSISYAVSMMGLITQFALDTIRIQTAEYAPPSDGKLVHMSSALVGICIWLSLEYNDPGLNARCMEIIHNSFPIRWRVENQRLTWNTYDETFRSKDVRINDKMANIGNWIRGMYLMRMRPGPLNDNEVDSVTRKYIKGLNAQHMKKRTGVFSLLQKKISKKDKSLLHIASDTIKSEHWVE